MNWVGFLDKPAALGAGVVQMDPLWKSQELDLSIESLSRLNGNLEERGLRIVVKGNSGGMGALSNPPESSHEDILFFRSKIEAATKLGAPMVRIVTRAYPYLTEQHALPQGTSREKVLEWVIANLKTLVSVAEDCGVRIAVENHGDLRIAELERILAEVNSTWLGIQFEVLEQVAIFEDPRLAAERLLRYAITVHWADAHPLLSDRGFSITACPPGVGLIDLDGIAKILVKLPQDLFVFTAFQAKSEDVEDDLIQVYLQDLMSRISTTQ